MIKLVHGVFGLKGKKKGTILNLSEEKEKRLVKRKVAVYVGDESVSFNATLSEIGELAGHDEKVFKTEDEIRSMKKDELVEYAAEIGIEDFDVSSTKDVMIDTILNYIDENFEVIE